MRWGKILKLIGVQKIFSGLEMLKRHMKWTLQWHFNCLMFSEGLMVRGEKYFLILAVIVFAFFAYAQHV
jgi:hypothetical protein